MQQDTTSFWSDIKTLDARLAENPDSFCFAQLAEVYLKVGMTDEALHLARQGTRRHPRYLAGQRTLAMACHAKGLQDECCTALEQVTAALPEDRQSQQMLAQLYLQAGDTAAAVHCFRTILDFTPDDSQAVFELQALQPVGAVVTTATDEEIIEELDEADILEVDELDLIEEEESEEELPAVAAVAATPAPAMQHDPLSTVTLAELYVKQGFVDKALIIYRAVVADNPGNQEVQARIAQLEATFATPAATAPEIESETVASVPPLFLEPEAAAADMLPIETPSPSPFISELVTEENLIGQETDLPTNGRADAAIATLTTWLDNIRRITSCR